MSTFTDANGNVINTTGSPHTNAATRPYIPPTGVSNRPLNAASVTDQAVQITAGGLPLAIFSNPA